MDKIIVWVDVMDNGLEFKAANTEPDIYFCEDCGVYHVLANGHVRTSDGRIYCEEYAEFDCCEHLE